MNRSQLIVIAAMLAGACAVQAQDGNPMTANLRQSWKEVDGLLTKMAEKMPDDGYRFKPTPEMQDFGQRMAHIVGADMRTCAQLKGEQKPLTLGTAPSKAEIVAAMKQTSEECDAAFSSLTDAELMKSVTGGRGGPRMKLAIIEGAMEHSQEMYGYMAVYLRLKGIVPPSSDRNER